MLDGLDAFTGTDYLSVDDITHLRSAHRASLFAFTSHVTSIVDAFGFTEFELDSVFARKDKTPYEALWDTAQESALTDNNFIRPELLRARSLWKQYEAGTTPRSTAQPRQVARL
jgi:hypothetical protein